MTLPMIFQDGMMLQRDKPAAVWGTAQPGSLVCARIQGRTAEAAADADGKWLLYLPPLSASESEELQIAEQADAQAASEIVIRDIAVGEVWIGGGQSNMEYALRYEKHRGDPAIVQPVENLRFYDVPEIAFDGQYESFDYSRVGRWRRAQSEEDLDFFCASGYFFQKEIRADLNVPVGIVGCNWGGTRSAAWISPESVQRVGGPWLAEYQAWEEKLDMEQYWQAQRENPENDTGNPHAEGCELIMPQTITMDMIRAIDPAAADALEAPQEPRLLPKDVPSALYEHMVKTIAPFTARGVLWYQGESDDVPGRQGLYRDMLTALISDWRALWRDPQLPFLIVQLPGWEKWINLVNYDYMTIRRCQQETADTVPGAYLCSISDSGEQLDIHPKDKKVVGERLALLARCHVYGEEVPCDPPRASGAVREQDDVIRIFFEHTYGAMGIEGGAIAALQVYDGETQISYEAETVGEALVIRLTQPRTAGALRISLAKERWYRVNLYNAAGLPAVPFELEI